MDTVQNPTLPQVGQGMTMCYPQDRYPFAIVRVSESGKTVWVKPLKLVSKDTGHEPAYFEGPFPVWSHSYTEEELKTMVEERALEHAVRLTSKGWSAKGTPFELGTARFHRNYSL